MKRILGLFLAVCLLLAGCGAEGSKKYTRNFFAMNTYMTMTAYGPHAEEGMKAAEEGIRAIEDALSVTREGSDVWRVNHRTDEAVTLGSDAEAVMREALALAEQTGGALDPTIYPVVEAWGFTKEQRRVPGSGELREVVSRTGWQRVHLEKNKLVLAPGMEIDFGALGKGYAGREAGRILCRHNVRSAIISLGGNVEAVGSRPDGTPWRVGLRAPDGEGYAGMISVRDAAVVTSGSYERYFVDVEGKRWHHIIDPATGYPAENGLLSVTVIGSDGLLCDALSTALFVMGRDRASAFWRSRDDFEMILIEEGRRITVTEGLEKAFSVLPEYTGSTVEVLRK